MRVLLLAVALLAASLPALATPALQGQTGRFLGADDVKTGNVVFLHVSRQTHTQRGTQRMRALVSVCVCVCVCFIQACGTGMVSKPVLSLALVGLVCDLVCLLVCLSVCLSAVCRTP